MVPNYFIGMVPMSSRVLVPYGYGSDVFEKIVGIASNKMGIWRKVEKEKIQKQKTVGSRDTVFHFV